MEGLITQWGVPAGVGVICLIAAVLLFTLGKKQWPWLILVLIIGASDALMSTPVGTYIHSAVTWANTETGSLIGRFTGVVVGGLVSITVLGILIIKVIRKERDNWTYTAGALAPPSVVLIPGVIGTVLTFAITLPMWLVSQVVSLALGW
jgi:hypothetical protein